MIDLIESSLELPNGVHVQNRLVKVAMEEGIGYGGGLPDRRHQELYRRWGEGGWGVIISGNVQVDPRHLATPHDRTIASTSQTTIAAYARLREVTLSAVPPDTARPLMIMQISHPGLQSSAVVNGSRAPWVASIGPTSARPDTGSSLAGLVVGRLVWPLKSRKVVDIEEWLKIVRMFANAAVVAEKAGWEGVQVHSAHGYLLAEYLSPLTNPDCLPLPGVPCEIPVRLHLLYLILKFIHDNTQRSFIKAIKINCSDFVQGGLDEDQSGKIIVEIVSWKLVDMLEVSGGNYSNPTFADLESITSPRQALFAHFTKALLPKLPSPPEGPAIILTGSIHTRALIHSSLKTRTCDLVGIGRPSCINPALPREIVFNTDIPNDQANFGGYVIPGGKLARSLLGGGAGPKPTKAPAVATYAETETANPQMERTSSGIPLIGAGVSTLWHEWQMCRMSRGLDPDVQMTWLAGAFWEGLVWAAIGAILRLFRMRK